MTDRGRPRDLSSLTGAWALGALTEDERREFEAYLADADDVRTEATELADTAVYLGLAATPKQPSPELKNRLMGLIESTPQLAVDTAPDAVAARPGPLRPVTDLPVADAPSVADAPRVAGVPGAADAPSVTEEPHTVDARAASARSGRAHAHARARWFTRPATVLAAAAAAVALVVGGTVVTRSVVAEQQLAAAVAEVADAPDARSATAEIATGGSATLYWSESLQRSALRMEGLDSLPDDKAYEFWYIDEAGEATPAGLLQASGDQRLVLDGDLEPGVTVGISIEPESGSPAPTTDPILAIPTA